MSLREAEGLESPRKVSIKILRDLRKVGKGIIKVGSPTVMWFWPCGKQGSAPKPQLAEKLKIISRAPSYDLKFSFPSNSWRLITGDFADL